jgi:hypothetical protein
MKTWRSSQNTDYLFYRTHTDPRKDCPDKQVQNEQGSEKRRRSGEQTRTSVWDDDAREPENDEAHEYQAESEGSKLTVGLMSHCWFESNCYSVITQSITNSEFGEYFDVTQRVSILLARQAVSVQREGSVSIWFQPSPHSIRSTVIPSK